LNKRFQVNITKYCVFTIYNYANSTIDLHHCNGERQE